MRPIITMIATITNKGIQMRARFVSTAIYLMHKNLGT